MTRPARVLALAGLIVIAAGGTLLLRQHTPAVPTPASPTRGGELVASQRTEPGSFLAYLTSGSAEELFSRLTQARLVRINRVTDTVEPRLAESWTMSDDHLVYTFKLRPGVRFSDGEPFTSADVVFSFQVAYDEASIVADDFKVAGRPIDVSAPDDLTVVLRFPAPSALGLRMLDALAIVPRHKLGPALAAHRLRDAWRPTTPPSEVVGLGPFMLTEYVSGQRQVFARNPYYWRQDEQGAKLPYLDRIVVPVVPDENAEVLQLESGQLDLITGDARPEDISAFREAAAAGRLQLVDAGVSLSTNAFWINLRPDGLVGDPRRDWLRSEDFRKALSHAIDRDAFVNAVYLGAAVPTFGPVTPGDARWYTPDLPTYPFDLERARTLLAGLGLTDRNGDGLLEDQRGAPVRFSVQTQQGMDARERAVAVIQQQLRRLGIVMDVVALAVPALVERYSSGRYDAFYFGIEPTDSDPAAKAAFWMSSGAFHFWNPGQSTPATEWEAQIDALMRRQVTTIDLAERQRLFAEVQRLFAEHVPALYFAAPRVYVPMSARVAGATPARFRPQVLWNADVLAITGGRGR